MRIEIMAGRYFASVNAALEVNYQFDLFAIDQVNQLRTPGPGVDNDGDGNLEFTFSGAVENFQARFADFGGGDSDPVNITNLFAERGENELDETGSSFDTGLISDNLFQNPLLPNGSIRLDEMGTSNGLPTEDIRREFVIQGIEITSSSDEISIVGTANQDEFARVDFLVFTESDI